MEVPRIPPALQCVFEQLSAPEHLRELVYLLGRETLVVSKNGRMGRLTEPVFALLSRNAGSIREGFSLPVKQVVELGMQVGL